MTRQDYEIYLLYKELDEKLAHKFLVKCRKKDRMNQAQMQEDFKVFRSSFDNWIEKIVFPHEFTKGEIQEYIDENWIGFYSAYDCTGRTFTQDIKCFPINGKTIVYHFKAIDC